MNIVNTFDCKRLQNHAINRRGKTGKKTIEYILQQQRSSDISCKNTRSLKHKCC